MPPPSKSNHLLMTEGWVPSSSRVVLNPCLKWMLLLMRCIDTNVFELPEDVCKIIFEYGRETWIVEHPGMKSVDPTTATVINDPFCSYPCRWSRGVKLTEKEAEFTVTITQGTDRLMDDRYMIGFLTLDQFVYNDYPDGESGSIFCLELDGSLVIDEKTLVSLSEEDLSSSVNVRFTISVPDRRFAVRINGCTKYVLLPDNIKASTNTFYPFVVLRNKEDTVVMNIENEKLLSKEHLRCPHPR
eukprot:TRINITY_DN19875_c0_g1_i1.p1 TRINITY_DN19875_c0_g1~~TRINITY_DN19875_c0_g1_i1.p1  ORF type:complete len:243 (+),score=25.09 TRINITY_DN19875_c0_g1_i1:112-840(+)